MLKLRTAYISFLAIHFDYSEHVKSDEAYIEYTTVNEMDSITYKKSFLWQSYSVRVSDSIRLLTKFKMAILWVSIKTKHKLGCVEPGRYQNVKRIYVQNENHVKLISLWLV